MKRLLAAILTLSMVLNLAPVGAFAASGKDVAQTAAEQAAQPDAALVQEIASDPFLNRQPMQQPESETTVDTSDVSMTATNSFGKLLLDGMDDTENSEEFSSGNKLTSVALNGRTAIVEYSAEETADLVVSIYQDSAEQKMVTSATVEVAPAVNGTAKVAIEATIPEYYIIKAFLLDKTEHAPLCKETSNTFNTKDMVDLEEATTASFPEDRVIDLDGNPSTNFAVVNPDVTLVTSDDNLPGTNQVVNEDDEGLNYTIANASDEIKNLQEGDILTYEYEPGALLIVRVAAIDVVGDTVTIAGDDTLEITDVFEALKISEQPGNEEIQYIGEGADEGVKYLGTEDVDFSDLYETDETNKTDFDASYNWSSDKDKPKEVTGKASKKFEFMKGEASDGFHTGSGVAPGAGDITGAFKGTVTGTVNLSISATVKYLIADGHTYVSFAASTGMKDEITVTGQFEERIVLGTFGFMPVPGVHVGFTPQIHVKAAVTLKASVSATATFGKAYDSETGVKDISSIPNVKVSASLSGEFYFGIDLAPNAKVLGRVATLELQAEIGASATATQKLWDTGITLNQTHVHGCSTCYSIDWKAKIILSLKLRFFGKEALKPEHEDPNSNSVTFEYDVGKAYYAPDYKDAGWGECPHEKYKALITVDCDNSEGTEIYLTARGKDAKSIGTINAQGYLATYLDPGQYTLTADVNGTAYRSVQFAIEKDEVRVILRAENPDQPTPSPDPTPDKPDPDQPEPDTPDKGVDYDFINNTLTIYTDNAMQDFESAEDQPWSEYRDQIVQVILKEDVTRIGAYAFAGCEGLVGLEANSAYTSIGDSAFEGCQKWMSIGYGGTVKEWLNVDVGANNEILHESEISCTDGTIIDYGTCGDDIKWALTSIGNFVAVGSGDMYNYKYGTIYSDDQKAPWYANRKNIKKVTLEEGITSVGEAAFAECGNAKTVKLPESVSVIEENAFVQCGVSKINLPSGLTKIGRAAFNRADISSIEIPAGVTCIENGVFMGCYYLTYIEIPDTVQEIQSNAFKSCVAMRWITLSKNITEIKGSTFYECRNLNEITIPDGVTAIGGSAFGLCENLTSVTIPESVKTLGSDVFKNCTSLKNIYYLGTMSQWKSLGYYKLNDVTVHCTDGDIDYSIYAAAEPVEEPVPEEIEPEQEPDTEEAAEFEESETEEPDSEIEVEPIDSIEDETTLEPYDPIEEPEPTEPDIFDDANTIVSGTTSDAGSVQYAEFKGLTAGNDYAVIVSLSETEPLKTGSLLYINQAEAGADGVLKVGFIASGAAAYVVACGRDAAVNPTPGKDDTTKPGGDSGTTVKPGGDSGTTVKPGGNTTKPGTTTTKPGNSGSSPNGGGTIIAVLLGGIAAVIAGVVAMLPVEVSGTVIQNQQAVLPNATVQLVQNDTVVTETTTSESGTFTLKAKRGDYTLRVLYQDAATGEQRVHTVAVSAPAKNLNVSF